MLISKYFVNIDRINIGFCDIELYDIWRIGNCQCTN